MTNPTTSLRYFVGRNVGRVTRRQRKRDEKGAQSELAEH